MRRFHVREFDPVVAGVGLIARDVQTGIGDALIHAGCFRLNRREPIAKHHIVDVKRKLGIAGRQYIEAEVVRDIGFGLRVVGDV